MTQLAAILFSALFTFAVCLCAGKLVLQSLRAKLYRSEEFFLGFVLGSACLSTLVFLLAAAGLAYPAVFLAAGLAIIGLALWRGAHRFSSERLPALPRLWGACFWTIYALFAVLYLGHALLPETAPDATSYHLALPARYLREHGFPATVRNMMESLSEGVEMLFLFAYPFAKYSAGSMVHYLFTLMTPLGMLSYARRVGLPEAGMAGVLLFFLSPVVGRLGTVGYIDVAVAAVVFAVFYLVEIWRERQSTPLLIAIGLLAGFGFATKYTAILAVPYALGIILYERIRRRESLWQPLLITAACALATMAPYLVKNAITVGNPLAPFANRYFPTPLMTVLLEDRYAEVMRHWVGVQMHEIPREILIGGSRLGGLIGPVFALAPLALLGLWSTAGRRLLLATAVFGATYFASIGTRFLVPAETFVALALAASLTQWRWSRALLVILVLAHTVLSWPRIVPLYTDRFAWILPRLPVRVAMRIRPEAEYLRQNIPDYDMAHLIDQQVPAGELVLATATFANLFQSHEIVVGWQSAPGQHLFDVLAAAVSPDLQPSIHHEFQFAPRPVRKLRLVLQDSAPRDWMKNEWSVSELRVFSNKVEVPRSPTWRLRASHNPAAVPLAFDGNLVTRWTSGEPLSPGMWLEVNLGAETKVDAVIVQSTSDQPPTPLRLEFETAAGRWEHPDVSLAIGRRRASPDLRRMATETLKLNAMHWLLVEPSAPFAEDMASHPALWGVALAAASGPWRLYRLE